MSTSTDGRRVVSPTLVGRSAELERLAAVVSSPPSVVVVDGEAGIGKTRLVAELAARPEVAGRRLLVGRCHRIRESFPLGPVIEALRGLGEALAAVTLSPVAGALRPLLPELAGLLPPAPEPLDDRAAERHRTFRGLVGLLESLSPAVLVLEDLHWADEQTADFVRYLLAEPPPKLSLVLTFRGEEVELGIRALTAALPAGTGRAEIVLAPLDRERTGELAAAIMDLSRVSDEFAGYLRERTSGLPFAIEELLALMRARGTLIRRGSGWSRRALDELDVPAGIRDSVLERVGGLTPRARTLVEVAAVLQVPVAHEVLFATAGWTGEQANPVLEEALSAGVLAGQHGDYGFRHLLAAQAVYEAVPQPRRGVLHGRAADALRAHAPVPLGQVAHHLRFAGRLEEWAVAAGRAADHAIELGNDVEAVRLLEDVLRHAPLTPEQAGPLAVTLARSAIEALRAREVADVVGAVLELDLAQEVRGELRFRLGLLLHESGDEPERAARLFAAAVDELDDRPDLKAWAMVMLGIPVTPDVALAEYRPWLMRALEVIPDVADPSFEVFLLGKVAMVLVPTGDPVWRQLLTRIETRTGGAPRHRREVNAYWSVGAEACFAGHYEVAGRLLAAGLRVAGASESPRMVLSLRSAVALLDLCRGSWTGLDDEVGVLVEELAAHPRAGIDVQVVPAVLALARGELDEAHRLLSDLVDRIEELGGFDVLPLPVTALIRLALAREDVALAAATADRLLAVVEPKGVWAPGVRALPAVAEALVAAGRGAEAAAVVERYAVAVAELDAPLAEPALRHARGILHTGREDSTKAARDLTAAADHYAALSCPYESALARELAGLALLEVGRADDAGEALRAALAGFRELGATWDAGRVAQAARQHGVTVPVHHRGGRPSYGAELSPREREVAELAAAGRTNKEIAADLYLSVNTVARHITAAMRKLGVTSRVAIIHRLGGADQQN